MQYSTLIRKKDKSYQYIITYKINDKWKTKSKQGFPLNRDGKELAKLEMDKAVEQLKKDTKNDIDPSLIGITFGEFSKMYLKHIELYREINTVLAFNTVLNHFVSLNNIELTKVSTMDIQANIDDMTRIGLNPNTIKDYIRKLKTIFNAARDEYNLISAAPTKNIKYSEDKSETGKKALNKKELDKLLSDFKNSKRHKQFYLVLLIASKSGLRLGEILALTWTDIDTKNHTITVNKQWKQLGLHEYGEGKLKSKNSNRVVPISEKTTKILNNSRNVVNINNRLFNFQNTDSVSICLNRLLKKGGYGITIHELRHTYATMLLSKGVDFKTVAKLMGHTVEQTMRTYSHVNDDMMKRATNIIENIF